MYLAVSSSVAMASLIIFLCTSSSFSRASDPDTRTDSFLIERELSALHEVNLFDRLTTEDDVISRQRIAAELSGIYLKHLKSDVISEDQREQIIAKSEVLTLMVPQDVLLDLRLELIVLGYAKHEQAADLSRLDLLDDQSRETALAFFESALPDLIRLSKLANAQVESLVRSFPRRNQSRASEYERKISDARALRSRAYFFHGWAGYTESVLSGTLVGPDAMAAFGWVLGFEGKQPVLEQFDRDLLEYDHVARAMLGLGLMKAQNQDFDSARVWLGGLDSSVLISDSMQRLTKQRLLEISLMESNWVDSARALETMKSMDHQTQPDTGRVIGVAQARMMVMYPLNALAGTSRVGVGGREGAIELARSGLEKLIEFGEIEHILELQTRFGELPLIDDGFISLYTQGLVSISKADASVAATDEIQSSLIQASNQLEQALQSAEASGFRNVEEYAADAAIQLVEVLVRLERYQGAYETIERYRALFGSEVQREAVHWAEILVFDAAVRSGQGQLVDQLSQNVLEYMNQYPGTVRADRLAVQYADTPYLDSAIVLESLQIEDPDNPIGLDARRKLIQVIDGQPALISVDPGVVFAELLEHAQWIWLHESAEFSSARDARSRLLVCRVVAKHAFKQQDVDPELLRMTLDRADSILEQEASLASFSQEFAFRRVQLLLIEREYERAGLIAMDSELWDDLGIQEAALYQVFEKVNQRFFSDQSASNAAYVEQLGRAILDIQSDFDEMDQRRSYVAESIATAAEVLYADSEDELLLEYTTGLRLRVWEYGKPSEDGVVRTAVLAEKAGRLDIALACWSRLVGTMDVDEPAWHRARYESLRLLFQSDQSKALKVYAQYQALYPDGSPEPWNSKILDLVSTAEVSP